MRKLLIAALMAGCGTGGDDVHDLVPCEFEGAVSCERSCVGFPAGDGPACLAGNSIGVNDGEVTVTLCNETFTDVDGRVGCCRGDGDSDPIETIRFFECEEQ